MRDLFRRLTDLAAAMERHHLRAVLIGSAAASLHGVEVAPHDADFLFEDGPAQRRRLAAVAEELGAELTRPFYRRGLRWRLTQRGFTADFLTIADGLPSARTLARRASRHEAGLWIASLDDLARSQRASPHPKARALLAAIEAVQAVAK